MKLIAITGSIGCGKTTLATIVKELGYAVYDMDAWVRRIYYNKSFLKQLGELFPNSVVNVVADKKYLRRIVFSDSQKLQQLEDLIYPFLTKKIRYLITKKARQDVLCFLDAPLLFEKGWNKYCQAVILADVPYEVQKKRVMDRDKISAEEFDRINDLQLKNSDKKELSDIIIETDKSRHLLKVELTVVIERFEQIW